MLNLTQYSGLDMLSCNAESKSLHLVETRRLNVSWYFYTHESRLLLLASGMQCKTFNGFQVCVQLSLLSLFIFIFLFLKKFVDVLKLGHNPVSIYCCAFISDLGY